MTLPAALTWLAFLAAVVAGFVAREWRNTK